MEKYFIEELPWDQTPVLAWIALLVAIAVSLFVLAKSADWLVTQAVTLSDRSGLPKMVIGATVVSLGTTTPEAAISVLAAIKGRPELALGNAVGSVICDTGLILGIAALIAPLPPNKRIVNRQGWVQLGAGILLVLVCFPWLAPVQVFAQGGRMLQVTGFVFLFLLAVYLWKSVQWAQLDKDAVTTEEVESDENASTIVLVIKLIAAIALVVLASDILIPLVEEAALRMSVPPGVIAATLVAFGTSLPELVTAISAARRGHGDLAVGNIIGADILNVLFVSGAAAAVTSQGLTAGPEFFRIFFPGMLFVLIVFRIGILRSKAELKRSFGFVLLGVYVLVTTAGFIFN